MFTKEDIKKRLLDGPNELRGSMDASRYKDYMLGLMFYKFLSDKTLQQFKVINGNQQKPTNEIFQDYKLAKEKMGSKVENMIQILLFADLDMVALQESEVRAQVVVKTTENVKAVYDVQS